MKSKIHKRRIHLARFARSNSPTLSHAGESTIFYVGNGWVVIRGQKLIHRTGHVLVNSRNIMCSYICLLWELNLIDYRVPILRNYYCIISLRLCTSNTFNRHFEFGPHLSRPVSLMTVRINSTIKLKISLLIAEIFPKHSSTRRAREEQKEYPFRRLTVYHVKQFKTQALQFKMGTELSWCV